MYRIQSSRYIIHYTLWFQMKYTRDRYLLVLARNYDLGMINSNTNNISIMPKSTLDIVDDIPKARDTLCY